MILNVKHNGIRAFTIFRYEVVGRDAIDGEDLIDLAIDTECVDAVARTKGQWLQWLDGRKRDNIDAVNSGIGASVTICVTIGHCVIHPG